jgi:hypothetical protein
VSGQRIELALEFPSASEHLTLRLYSRGMSGETGVCWHGLRCVQGERVLDIPLRFPQAAEQFPPPELPNLRPAL